MDKIKNEGKYLENVELFNEKNNCCSCGACLNICPKHAIIMKGDEYGFVYPFIDESKCIKCGLCKTVCAYQYFNEINTPLEVYAATAKNEQMLIKSASGGIFAAFATKVIKDGGVVFGAALDKKTELNCKHIVITNENDITRIQGSKYVHSSIGSTYREAKEYLLAGRRVLFSGTPCQIAGLKSYLGKSYDNLITVDLICHGVPSGRFFKSYLDFLEKKWKAKIFDFKFRDKTKGWGLIGKVSFKTTLGRTDYKFLPCKESSYYSLFLNSEIYRCNCYTCKYASSNRPGDFTIGDYWGIQIEHPEILGNKYKNKFNDSRGISCIIVNSEKGKAYLELFKDSINLILSTFEKVARHNRQLIEPSSCSLYRNKVLEIYRTQGYSAVDKYFLKRVGIKIYIYKLKRFVPRRFVTVIKKIMWKKTQ